MESGVQGLLLRGQVVIVLACQLVFWFAQEPTAYRHVSADVETAYRSRESNVRQICFHQTFI